MRLNSVTNMFEGEIGGYQLILDAVVIGATVPSGKSMRKTLILLDLRTSGSE